MRVTTLMSAWLAATGVTAVALPEPLPAAQPDGTLSARQTQTSTDPKWTDHTQFRDSLINRHNQYRGQHAVGGLTWNKTLSGFAAQYLNKRGTGLNQCPNWEHSGGPYGENLAIGYGTPTQAVVAWGEERKQYNFNKPGFSGATGHFTQMVWKATTQLGCARKFCTSSNIQRGWYLVCEYYPRGNVIGQFDKQVLRGSYNGRRDLEDLPSVDAPEADLGLDLDADVDAGVESEFGEGHVEGNVEGNVEGHVGGPLVFFEPV